MSYHSLQRESLVLLLSDLLILFTKKEDNEVNTIFKMQPTLLYSSDDMQQQCFTAICFFTPSHSLCSVLILLLLPYPASIQALESAEWAVMCSWWPSWCGAGGRVPVIIKIPQSHSHLSLVAQWFLLGTQHVPHKSLLYVQIAKNIHQKKKKPLKRLDLSHLCY